VVVTTDARLGDPLDLSALDAVLTDAENPERPMLFGHDPDFSELVADLCGASNAPMRKGALARIEVDRPLHAGGGTLRWLIPPDTLKPKR
jgi:phosphohistidine phosphatase SixA